MMTIYLDRAAQEKILEDRDKLRFCDNRENKAGMDWCFSEEDCPYKDSATLHSPEPFRIHSCTYLRLYNSINRG